MGARGAAGRLAARYGGTALRRQAMVAVVFLGVSLVSSVAQNAVPARAPDGRAPQFISPLVFSPKPGAPFMAIARTVWVQNLPDHSTVTRHNERAVARDGEGRIFEERRALMPGSEPQATRIVAQDYIDAQASTLTRCFPGPNYCEVYDYRSISPSPAPAGLQPDKTTYLTRENLGTEIVSGLETQHTRETLTLYAESVGNSKTILRSVDYWYSPKLGVNVQVKRHDPRDGDQTLWLTDVTESAPDPVTFNLPENYKTVDLTHTGAVPGPVVNRWRPQRAAASAPAQQPQ